MKVSVIVPAWGDTPLLERACASIRAQTHRDIELAVCAPPANGAQTLPAARMAGLSNTTGEWVAFCDADDWIEPEAIERMLNAARRENADCICCAIVRDMACGRSVRRPFDPEGPSDTHNALVNKLFKRELLENLSIDESIALGEDLMISAQAMRKARRIAILEKAFYHYCENPESITHASDWRKKVEDLARVGELLREAMPEEKYAAFHDRVARDALLLWIRHRVFDRRLWRRVRSRMTTPLLSDRRHGAIKKGALAFAACIFD